MDAGLGHAEADQRSTLTRVVHAGGGVGRHPASSRTELVRAASDVRRRERTLLHGCRCAFDAGRLAAGWGARGGLSGSREPGSARACRRGPPGTAPATAGADSHATGASWAGETGHQGAGLRVGARAASAGGPGPTAVADASSHRRLTVGGRGSAVRAARLIADPPTGRLRESRVHISSAVRERPRTARWHRYPGVCRGGAGGPMFPVCSRIRRAD